MGRLKKLLKRDPIFTYNSESMEYRRITRFRLLLYMLVFGFVAFTCGSLINMEPGASNNMMLANQEEVPVIVNQDLEFTEKALWDLLVDMNVRYPHIVIAQARIESAHYESPICVENNNLFGMKVAKHRCTTHQGEQRGHAYYENWQMSAIDYAFYQTSYMRKCNTETQYLEALSATYAEGGPAYGDKIRNESRIVLKDYLGENTKVDGINIYVLLDEKWELFSRNMITD